MINGKILLVATALTAVFMLAMQAASRAEDCPAGVKACKIVVMTPEEENTLVGPEMIFDHATWAARAKFESLVNAWKEKLKQSPAGTVKAEHTDTNTNATKKEMPPAKK